MLIGLQFICETYGIEYKKLAEKLDTSPQNINSWLRGKRKIPFKRLEQLKSVFLISQLNFSIKSLVPQIKYLYRKYSLLKLIK